MASLKVSVLANLLGTAFTSVLAMLLVPIYLHLLGVEAYGLIGFFVSMRTIFGLLNLGLSPATNREISRRSRFPEKAWESLNLVRSLEVIFYLIGAAIALAMALSSRWIAGSWIEARDLSPEVIRTAIVIFGVNFMLRWPLELYIGVFRGLERQPLLNALSSAASLVSGVGGVLVLLFVSRTITAFLVWQGISSLVELVVTARVAWVLLKKTSASAPRFDTDLLRTIWRYSAGMTGVSFLAVILKQMDKILISKLLPLEHLGYYTAANSASSGMGNLVNPISKSTFPRFSALIAAGEWKELAVIYHKSAKITAFFAAPAAMALIFYSHDILLLWTRSAAVADHGWMALSVLSAAALMNSFMGPAQALNLASGQTSIPLATNFIGVILLLPVSIFLVGRHGILGAGISWLLFNAGYFLIVPWFIHRHVLKGHIAWWYLRDTLPFAALALALVGGFRYGFGRVDGTWLRMGVLGASLAVYAGLGIRWCPPALEILGKVWQRMGKSPRNGSRKIL